MATDSEAGLTPGPFLRTENRQNFIAIFWRFQQKSKAQVDSSFPLDLAQSHVVRSLPKSAMLSSEALAVIYPSNSLALSSKLRAPRSRGRRAKVRGVFLRGGKGHQRGGRVRAAAQRFDANLDIEIQETSLLFHFQHLFRMYFPTNI